MYQTKAYSAASATAPLAGTTIARRDPTEHDVQIEILFCGICHSDLHSVRNEWSEFMPTVYPIVPGHEIVGRVTKIGSAVTNYKPGDLAAVGCLVDSDRTCPRCKAGLENFCPNLRLTFNSPDSHLGGVGHAVTIALDGRDGLAFAEAGGFDLLILDCMLPGMSGLQIAGHLRARRDRTPILMLTARDAASDIVKGLDTGADDYLTKPFSFEVLLARVRAVGRRGPIAQPVVLDAAGLTLHLGTRQVRRGPRKIELTRTEYAILERLMRNAGRVLTRESLIESVWGGDAEIESNTLDAFVRLLRGKIEAAGESRVLRTVRGVGYCLRREDE
jgi:DNA-binding response OmpR family regulator